MVRYGHGSPAASGCLVDACAVALTLRVGAKAPTGWGLPWVSQAKIGHAPYIARDPLAALWLSSTHPCCTRACQDVIAVTRCPPAV